MPCGRHRAAHRPGPDRVLAVPRPVGRGISQAHSIPVNVPCSGHIPDPGAVADLRRLRGVDVIGRAAAPLFAGGIAGVVAGDLRDGAGSSSPPGAEHPGLILWPASEPRRGAQRVQAFSATSWPRTPRCRPRRRRLRTAAQDPQLLLLLAGMARSGFALFSSRCVLNLYLEDELGLSAWERGWFGSAVVCRASPPWPRGSPGRQALQPRNPAAAVAFVGALVAPSGCSSWGALMPTSCCSALLLVGVPCRRPRSSPWSR